jgi:predicted anti-sigma-YlaC factor YlaD
VTDYGRMKCEQIREMLSAQLDGEERAGESVTTDAHLRGCPDCRQWLDDAAAVTRLVRTRVVTEPSPDLSDAVLAAAPQRRQGPRLVGALRLLLGVLSAVQILLGVAQIAAAARSPHPHGADHLWHESAAWNVAVGAGFLWIALRRGRPVGMLPTLTAFIGVLILLTVNDMMVSTVDLDRVLSHGFMIGGYLIVLLLSRLGREAEPPAGARAPHSGVPSGRAGGGDPARPALRLLPGLPGNSQPQNRRNAA